MDKTGVLIKLFFNLILVKFQVIKWGKLGERGIFGGLFAKRNVFLVVLYE